MEITDDIVKKFIAGNEEAFNVIFKSFYPGLCNFVHKITKDKISAEEVVQNLFVLLWENRRKINITTSLKAYLYQSAFNNAVRYVKKQKKFVSEKSLKNVSTETEQELNHIIAIAELEEKVHLTIEQLPPKCKEVFKLNRFDGFKYYQIAEQLNISVKTVEAHITKALKFLHEAFEK